jgi:hypothetical protein
LRLVFEREVDGVAIVSGFRQPFVAAALTSQIGAANATTASRPIKALFSVFDKLG